MLERIHPNLQIAPNLVLKRQQAGLPWLVGRVLNQVPKSKRVPPHPINLAWYLLVRSQTSFLQVLRVPTRTYQVQNQVQIQVPMNQIVQPCLVNQVRYLYIVRNQVPFLQMFQAPPRNQVQFQVPRSQRVLLYLMNQVRCLVRNQVFCPPRVQVKVLLKFSSPKLLTPMDLLNITPSSSCTLQIGKIT